MRFSVLLTTTLLTAVISTQPAEKPSNMIGSDFFNNFGSGGTTGGVVTGGGGATANDDTDDAGGAGGFDFNPGQININNLNDFASQIDNIFKLNKDILNKETLNIIVKQLNMILDLFSNNPNIFKQFYPKIQKLIRIIGSLEISDNKNNFKEDSDRFSMLSAIMSGQKHYNISLHNITIHIPKLSIANKTISVIQWVQNPYQRLSQKRIFSKVVSITLSDMINDNEIDISNLNELINITLPLIDFNFNTSRPQCVYWDVTANEWLSKGCYLNSYTTKNVTCGCNHLTDFSVTDVPNNNGIVDNNQSNNSKYISVGAGIAIGAGCIAGIALVAFIVFKITKSKQNKRKSVFVINPVSNV